MSIKNLTIKLFLIIIFLRLIINSAALISKQQYKRADLVFLAQFHFFRMQRHHRTFFSFDAFTFPLSHEKGVAAACTAAWNCFFAIVIAWRRAVSVVD